MGSYKMTPEEFLNKVSSISCLPSNEIRDVFDMMDLDGDGKLSLHEFAGGLKGVISSDPESPHLRSHGHERTLPVEKGCGSPAHADWRVQEPDKKVEHGVARGCGSNAIGDFRL